MLERPLSHYWTSPLSVLMDAWMNLRKPSIKASFNNVSSWKKIRDPCACISQSIISLCARQNDVNAHVILPGAHRSARHMRRTFDTCFTLSLIYHLYVLFVWISYQARFGLKISYPAIVFTMVIGLLNCGSFIVHILLLGTSKVFTLSVFLPCACVHVLLPGTQRYGL